MKLNRRQKAAAAVAACSVLALIVDRLFLSPPAGAAAAGAAGVPAVAPAGPGSNGDVALLPEVDETTPRAVLARRFEQLAAAEGLDPTQVGNAFMPVADWLPPGPAGADPAVDVGPVTDARVRAFLDAHRLNALMANDRAGYAVIDGKALRLGQTLDGFRLVEVRDRSVILEADDVRVQLKLPEHVLGAGEQ